MVFRLTEETLISERTKTTYDVSRDFERVLRTLDDDEVPSAIVALGILTEQATPRDGSLNRRIDAVTEQLDSVTPPDMPPQTVQAVLWLLHEVDDTLNPSRKGTIGHLIDEAGLNSPGRKSPAEARDKATDEQTTTDKTAVSKDADNSGTSPGDATRADTSDEMHGRDTHDEPDSGAVQCDFCDATFRSTDTLVSHAIQCEERPPDEHFKCEHCGNAYVTESALNDHLQDCDKTSNFSGYVCDNCGTEFDTPRELFEHRETCSVTPDGTVRDIEGKVVHYEQPAGYGFVRTDALSEDVFVHASRYPGEPQEHDIIRFDAKPSDEGYEAVRIAHVGHSEPADGKQKRPGQPESWDETFSSKRPRWGNDN